MAINPNAVSDANSLAIASQSIMDIISKQQQMDKVQALLKLLEITDIDITITGDKYKVLNLELITEYTGKDMTKFMVKNETYRRTIQKAYHYRKLDDEKLIGYMDSQIILKMNSHRRKRVQEIINGLKNDVANTEVIPQNVKKKRFFGLG
jgi:hypothetical protein